MYPSKRILWFFALAAIVAVTAACGGQPAEEPPAEEAPAEEEAAPAEEQAPVVPEIPPVEEEPQEPAEPPLEGNIVEVGAGEMGWNRGATREQPGEYYWVVRLRNDTTQVLDITVTYQFLDVNEEVIKTDRHTLRVSPAETGEFRVVDEMERDAARSVEYTTYFWDWERVEGD